MKVTYSIFVLDLDARLPIENSEPFYFEKNTFIVGGCLEELFKPGTDFSYWEKWIGSTKWEEITSGSVLLISWEKYNEEGSVLSTSKPLGDTNYIVHRCLPLVTSLNYNDGDVYVLKGTGELNSDKLLIDTIDKYSTINGYKRAMFLSHRLKFDDPYFDRDKVMEDWKGMYQSISKIVFKNKNVQFTECFRSFEEAFHGKYLEFKIPNLVRAIEALIVCRRATGFAEKIIWLIGNPPIDDTYGIKENFKEMLQAIYDLRNDVSHGQQFGWNLQKSRGYPITTNEVATYELLLEWTAREVIKKSLQTPSIQHLFADRNTLETAWNDYMNVIPKANSV